MVRDQQAELTRVVREVNQRLGDATVLPLPFTPNSFGSIPEIRAAVLVKLKDAGWGVDEERDKVTNQIVKFWVR